MFDLYTPSAIEDAVRLMRKRPDVLRVVLDHETDSEVSYSVTRKDGFPFDLWFRKAPPFPEEEQQPKHN